MQLDRKLTTLALGVVLAAASVAALQQTSTPVKRAEPDSTPAAAPVGSFNTSPVQAAIRDLIVWEQSTALTQLGGIAPSNYAALPPHVLEARQEIVYACNLYQRVTLDKAQQVEFDKILDPKNHPLPEKWARMYLQGTLVSALLKTTPEQNSAAQAARDRFFGRNSDVLNGRDQYAGIPRAEWPDLYRKNMAELAKELRGILTPEQNAEIDPLIAAYKNEVKTAMNSALGRDKP